MNSTNIKCDSCRPREKCRQVRKQGAPVEYFTRRIPRLLQSSTHFLWEGAFQNIVTEGVCYKLCDPLRRK